MNLKEYKERKEAKAYFRSQSSYYLDNATLIKDILISLGIGIVVGVAYGFFKMVSPINLSIFIILVGYLVSYMMQQIINHRNIQIAVVAVVATILACYVANVVSMYSTLHIVASVPRIMFIALRWSFSNILTDLYIVLSCILAYKMND